MSFNDSIFFHINLLLRIITARISLIASVTFLIEDKEPLLSSLFATSDRGTGAMFIVLSVISSRHSPSDMM